MASQERLEYFISAAFKDEGVRQAMQAFAKLNAESAKVVNELDRISKAGQNAGQKIRDSRTPYAQLGMQVNQLGSQLAGGTSFAVAFAQQIGDVGWALQNAKGILGTVGRFLAGPWGAAIAIGATALSPLIERLFGVKDAAEEAKTSFDKFMKSLDTSSLSSQAANEIVNKKIAALGAEGQANLKIQKEIERINKMGLSPEKTKQAIAASGYINLLRQQATAQRKVVIESDNQLENLRQGLKIQKMQADQSAVMNTRPKKEKIDKVSDLDVLRQAQDAIIAQFKAGTISASEFETKLKAVTDGYKEAKNPAEEYLKEWERQDRVAEKFRKTIADLGQKELPDWEAKLNDVKSQYEELSKTTRLTTQDTEDFGNQVKALLTGPIDEQIKKYDEMIAKARGIEDSFANTRMALLQRAVAEGKGIEEVLQKLALLDQMQADLKIEERNAEIRKSFETIGMSVNDAFKGMLTAGMSWKDGMKGIINAVIDELWRLFVVQQIVGMVKNVLGGFFGNAGITASTVSKLTPSVSATIASNPSFFANGTPSAPGGLSWVGERGPELINLPRGSQVIPAHRASQMGSGGMTINVDARGSADPAAVRAQVQQGILEAAPAIIAAAQQRTVSGLRRPKLGGVMQ